MQNRTLRAGRCLRDKELDEDGFKSHGNLGDRADRGRSQTMSAEIRMEFTKLQRQRAADEVYQALRQALVGYHIKPGERLDVEDLSAKFGVSLTPVRGALQQLATEGLVEIRARGGTFVASLTAQEWKRPSSFAARWSAWRLSRASRTSVHQNCAD
jgi:DNA-binding transcriptional regulator YhcF (GntR family)